MKHIPSRAALAGALALAATFAPAAAAQAHARCRPSASRTLAADSYARVYGRHGKAYVCVRASGRTSRLAGASPQTDQFALGGKWVGWSSTPSDPTALPDSVVTVMRITDHYVNPYFYPFDLNETVNRIVVLADGAAAWAMTPTPGSDTSYTEIQGTDRSNNPPDQFSDDHTNVIASSLAAGPGRTVTWSYDDGTTGSQLMY
jgi:hypothetical protein